LPTRQITARYDQSSPTNCPFCLSVPETINHLVRCNQEQCHTWRGTFVSNLRERGETLHTNPVLLDILIQGLDLWLRHQPPPSKSAYPAVYQSLIQEQSVLGWCQLLNGRWSRQWATM
jgi:hypothetical protein